MLENGVNTDSVAVTAVGREVGLTAPRYRYNSQSINGLMHRPLGSEEPRHRSRSSPPHHWRTTRPLASASRVAKPRTAGPPSSTKARGNGNPTTDREGRPTAEPDNRTDSGTEPRTISTSRSPGDLPLDPGCSLLVECRPSAGAPVPSDPVELTKQIKAASDIVAVVGSYLSSSPPATSSRPSAPSTTTPAPPSTSTPSASATAAGPAAPTATSFTFVQHMEKVGFNEARAILADAAGIKLDEQPNRPQDHTGPGCSR